MDKEKLEKANRLEKEIRDTTRYLENLKNVERRKSWGLKISLNTDTENHGLNEDFVVPKEATDVILAMSKTLLENKLNRLMEEFNAL